MNFQETLSHIQHQLKKYKLDGWLIYDFHGSNKFAHELLGISPQAMLTRRFFYWIPQKGEPEKILHRIEAESLEAVPGKKHLYLSWIELEERLAKVLKGAKVVAMEYSPRNNNPYVSVVDAGTIEIVRDLGIEVVSSANLLQHFTSVLDEEQIYLHLEAAQVVKQTSDRAWDLISDRLRAGKKVNEYDVQQFILSEFLANDCITEDGPLCAVNGHSAMPHYVATRESAKPINRGDFILIDLWCKKNVPRAIYADITRVAIAAADPTPMQEEIFKIVKRALDVGIELITSKMEKNEPFTGAEIDDACRDYIKQMGYGDYFTHRTGHNIGTSVHGAGAHLDNLETADKRQILPGTCFSIEPGIYLPEDFGVRIEYDILIKTDRSVMITGGREESLICLPV